MFLNLMFASKQQCQSICIFFREIIFTKSCPEIDFTEKCTYQVFQFRLKPNPSLPPKVRLISMMFKMAWIPQGFIAQTIIGIYLIW